MVSIKETQDTYIDFKELDAFYEKISYLTSPTGLYFSNRLTIDEEPDEIVYEKHIFTKFANLKSSIHDLNYSDDRSIKDISDVTKLSLECIVLIVFYLKSLGIPVTNCWKELVRELVSKKLKNEDVKHIFTAKSEYNANIESALLEAIEERAKLLKSAKDFSNELYGVKKSG